MRLILDLTVYEHELKFTFLFPVTARHPKVRLAHRVPLRSLNSGLHDSLSNLRDDKSAEVYIWVKFDTLQRTSQYILCKYK